MATNMYLCTSTLAALGRSVHAMLTWALCSSNAQAVTWERIIRLFHKWHVIEQVWSAFPVGFKLQPHAHHSAHSAVVSTRPQY